MTTVFESLPNRPIHEALSLGVDTLGQHETVSFTPYIRTILPLDRFAFWVNANLLSAEKLAQHGLASADPVVVNGSLHYASVGSQLADETLVVRSVDFTAEAPITALSEVAYDVIYVGQWNTPLGSFKFSFSQRNSFYYQASLFHYVGDAVMPAFEAQLIDNYSAFDQSQVVSNSLPIWLSMFTHIPYVSLITISVPVYPAFLVPTNLLPAYVAIEIQSNSTRALQAVPTRGYMSEHLQLTAERVRMTAYGLRNDAIMDLMDYVLDYSLNTGNVGLMNTPIVRDEHRPQMELAVLAQKKTIDWEISYFQHRSRNIARQLILSAIPNFPIVYLPRDRFTVDGMVRVTESGEPRTLEPDIFSTDLANTDLAARPPGPAFP